MSALLIGLACADSEMGPYAYVQSTDDGRYYFRMVPDTDEPWNHDRGRGEAYEVTADGPDRLLWTTSGWYAFEIYLAWDGAHLVRLGNWPRGHQPSNEHLAIAFYDRGRLLRRYSTKDLIVDRSAVRPSVSHYQFRGEVSGFDPRSMVFRMTTVDGVEYAFDATSGEMTEKIPR